MRVIGAVDLGGTKIAAGAVTENGAILSRLECPTAPEEGFAAAMGRTREMLREAARRAGAAFDGIGIASSGPVDPNTGILGDVGTLPGWRGGNLAAELAGVFGVPAAVENDADGAALGEARWGVGAHSNRFLYVTVSTGIGGGIVLGGELYRGVEGAHPEVGHQTIDPSGPLCYCRARGCWESLASGTAMEAWVREQRPEGARLAPAEICRLAAEGDELAGRAVEREGYYLGLGLANLVTLFAPDTIALGGGMMKSAHLFLDRARVVVLELCTQVPAAKTRITTAALGTNAGLAGAAQAWLNRYRA